MKKYFLSPEFDKFVTDEDAHGIVQEIILNAYEVEHLSCAEIASFYSGVNRHHIYRFLKERNVDTSNPRIKTTCSWCETEFTKTRKRYRSSKRHFCTDDCRDFYMMEIGISNKSGMGGKIAHTVVSQHFKLEDEHVIHHEDRNRLNNTPHNLKVFADAISHVRYHRGVDVEPLWDGSKEFPSHQNVEEE